MTTTETKATATLTIWGIALNANGRIEILKNIRERFAPGPGCTRTLRNEWTGETFPNTRKGQKQAEDIIFARNAAQMN